MYTEQSQDKLRKMKAGIHREVLTGRAVCGTVKSLVSVNFNQNMKNYERMVQ